MRFVESAVLITALSIFLLTFIFEDAAVLAGAFLATTGKIPWEFSFAICFIGVMAGNIVLYSVARYCGRSAVDRLIPEKLGARALLDRTEALFRRYGWLALVSCRFLPGSRLPTYLTAGLLRMHFWTFLLGSSLFALVWVILIFFVVGRVGAAAPELFKSLEHNAELIVAGAVFVGLLVWLLRGLPRYLKKPRSHDPQGGSIG